MKQFLFPALILLGLNTNVNAQSASNYQALDWDILRVGYVKNTAKGAGGGLSIGSELRYNVSNRFAAGLRAEAQLSASGSSDSASIGGSTSLSLTGDYYFKEHSNSRAFVGAAIGTYLGSSVSVSNIDDPSNANAGAGTAIGFTPRIGYDLGAVRTTVEYNIIPKKGITNYLSLNLALNLFGRYKKNK